MIPSHAFERRIRNPRACHQFDLTKLARQGYKYRREPQPATTGVRLANRRVEIGLPELRRLIEIDKPAVRVGYDLDILSGSPSLQEILEPVLQ